MHAAVASNWVHTSRAETGGWVRTVVLLCAVVDDFMYPQTAITHLFGHKQLVTCQSNTSHRIDLLRGYTYSSGC